MNSTVLKVLLDSTYLLPSFGIEVEGLTDREIAGLRKAKIEGKVKFYCSPLSWIEIIGKVCREIEHANIELDNMIVFANGKYQVPDVDWKPDSSVRKKLFVIST